jgi:SAM-dependent methyltransferase
MSALPNDDYYKFDRKTFDPKDNHEHEVILNYLRQIGARRLWGYKTWAREKRLEQVSSALRNLTLRKPHQKKIYLDVGCGDSPDVLIAAELGYEAYGLDLFPPKDAYKGGAKFIKTDVAENIPFGEGIVHAITSQAMIDLIEPEKRLDFYKEVYRVLESGGTFSQIGIHLANGHGFNNQDEIERVRQVGFRAVWGQVSGLMAVK